LTDESRSPAKPSRPARAYLKVKEPPFLDTLSAKVKVTPFQDAKNTTKDPCLVGPPSLEYAPYNKVASGRIRHDGRQGTIDQDQEFIDFLQSLTEPIAKPAANGTDGELALDKVTTTPLVQYLKEKKANKAKEAAEKKTAKQREAKDAKEKKEKPSTVVVEGPTTAAEKARVAKATQDAVTAINKSVAAMQTGKASAAETKTTNKSVPTEAVSTKDTAAATPPPAKRERERGNVSAAARMLQRDLGLTPRGPRAGRTASNVASPASNTATPVVSGKVVPPTPSTDSKPTTTPAPSAPPLGPRAARSTPTPTKPVPPATTATPPATRPFKPFPNPSAGAKSAFLKHANPSQGVTEELLRAAFEAFGGVTRCEIDKKKGLGYVDFDSTETLKKAMHASPIKVGNGNVVVMENRNVRKATATATAAPATAASTQSSAAPKPTTPAAAVAASPAPTAAKPAAPAITPTPTAAATAEKTASPAPAPATPSTPTSTSTPPTAPRASTNTATNPRGAARGGSMRGNNPVPRGNFTPPARGGPRGGFRGGRGSFGPRSGRGAAQAVAAANNAGTGTGGSASGASVAAQSATGQSANTGAGGGDAAN
jgi:regulator of nonsense transcripts 3